MVEAIAICQHLLFLDKGMHFSSKNLKLMLKKKQQERHCHYVKALSNLKQQLEKDYQKKPLTLHHSISTDAPLYESSKASFDQYMVDEQRVLKALFPGIKGSKKLNKTRWELEGLPDKYRPRDFSISVKGTIYPDRQQGKQSRLRTQLEVIVSFIVSPLLGWVPHSVMHSLTESLVKTVMADSTSNGRLLEDYDEFKTKNVV
ncbi:hypothetical protein ACLB2K_061810 [Fragaria x ananassa]